MDSYSVQAILTLKDNLSAGLKNAAGATESLGSKFKSAVGLGAAMQVGMGAVSKAVNTMSNHIGDAVSRYDQLNNFPKVMSNLGIESKASSAALKALDKGITGLPTTLDAATQGVTRFVSKNGNIKKSTDYFLAMNNAIVAGGVSAELQGYAVEQLSQAYSKGKMEMEEWRSIQTAMPAQLNQIAKAMGMTADELGEGLRDGSISMDEFMDTMVQMNKKGVAGFASFEKQARGATGGIKTAFINAGTAVTRGLANCIGAVDEMLADNGLPTIAEMANKAGTAIDKAFKGAANTIKKINIDGMIEGLTPAFNALKAAAGGAGKVIKKVAGFLNDHAKAASGMIPLILLSVAGFKAYKKISSFLQPATGAFEEFNRSAKKPATAMTSLKNAFGSFMKMAGIAAIIASLSLLATSFSKLGALGTTAVAPLTAFGAVVSSLAIVFATFGTKLQASMLGIAVFAASVSAMALAMAPIAQTGLEGAAAMGTFGVVVGGLAVIFATFGTALTAAIPAMLAFGAAVLLAGTGIGQAAPFVSALIPLVSQVGDTFSQVAGAVAGAVSQIVSVVGGTLCSVMQTAGDTISQVSQSISNGFQTVCDGVSSVINAISGGFSSVLDSIAGIINSIGTSARNAGEGFHLVAQGITAISELSLWDIGKSLAAVAAGMADMAISGRNLPEVAAGMQGIMTSLTMAAGSVTAFALAIQVLSSTAPKVSSSVESIKSAFSNFTIKTPDVSGVIAALNRVISAARTTGQQAGQALGNGLKSGRATAQSAVSAIIAALNSAAGKANASGQALGNGFASGMQVGLNQGVSIAASAGQNIGNRFTASLQSGLAKSKSVATQAVNAATAALRTGQSAAYSAGAMIGAGFAAGMRAYLGQIQAAAAQMAAAADAAIRAKAKIHSPSKVTESHGKNLAAGLAKGIWKRIKGVRIASRSLVNAAMKTMGNASNTRDYEGASEKALKQYEKSINKKTKNTTKSFNKTVNQTIKALKKQNPKLKKQYNKLGDTLKTNFSKTIEKQGKKVIAAAEKSLDALAKTYQEKYDKIANDRSAYFETLSDYGSLYSVDSYGFIALKDFKAQTAQVKALEKNMEQLKKSLPYDLMLDIQGLDTASALAYTNELLKKGDSWLKQYGKDYTTFIDTSKSMSNAYYQSYIDQIDKDYSSAVTATMKKLKTQMNKIGQQAVEGMTKGLTSKKAKKSLNKAANTIANTIVKTLKKKLKIHSPSRVLMQLGTYTGEGFVNGIAAMQKQASEAMERLTVLPQISEPALAGSFAGELSADYEYSRNAQYTIVVPVNMDGKEVARVTAPYTEAELNRRQTRENRKRGIR